MNDQENGPVGVVDQVLEKVDKRAGVNPPLNSHETELALGVDCRNQVETQASPDAAGLNPTGSAADTLSPCYSEWQILTRSFTHHPGCPQSERELARLRHFVSTS